ALYIGSVWAADIGAFVPIDAEPVQDFQNAFGGALDQPVAIGILDTEDHGSAKPEPLCFSLGEEPIEECGAGAADMKQPGRAGSVAHANGAVDGNGRIGHGASRTGQPNRSSGPNKHN